MRRVAKAVFLMLMGGMLVWGFSADFLLGCNCVLGPRIQRDDFPVGGGRHFCGVVYECRASGNCYCVMGLQTFTIAPNTTYFPGVGEVCHDFAFFSCVTLQVTAPNPFFTPDNGQPPTFVVFTTTQCCPSGGCDVPGIDRN